MLAFDCGGDGPPGHALQRAGLPEQAVAVILAHPDPRVRIDFAMSTGAEPAQRARLADDPSPKVRAALAYGPEWRVPRTVVAPLPDAVCGRLCDDPDASVRSALLDSPHLVPSFVASLATHHDPAARRGAVSAWEILPPGERSALLADPDPEVRRAAALSECRQDAHVTAELLRDPKSARGAAPRPPATRRRRTVPRRADAPGCPRRESFAAHRPRGAPRRRPGRGRTARCLPQA
ncbi:hypothetical protein ACQ4WX_02115 [Streptomyces lasalocidi]